MRLHRTGRFDNLRRIETLDPEVDADEILALTRHRPTTYPHGHPLADLGPTSMLAHLNGAEGAATS